MRAAGFLSSERGCHSCAACWYLVPGTSDRQCRVGVSEVVELRLARCERKRCKTTEKKGWRARLSKIELTLGALLGRLGKRSPCTPIPRCPQLEPGRTLQIPSKLQTLSSRPTISTSTDTTQLPASAWRINSNIGVFIDVPRPPHPDPSESLPRAVRVQVGSRRAPWTVPSGDWLPKF